MRCARRIAKERKTVHPAFAQVDSGFLHFPPWKQHFSQRKAAKCPLPFRPMGLLRLLGARLCLFLGLLGARLCLFLRLLGARLCLFLGLLGVPRRLYIRLWRAVLSVVFVVFVLFVVFGSLRGGKETGAGQDCLHPLAAGLPQGTQWRMMKAGPEASGGFQLTSQWR